MTGIKAIGVKEQPINWHNFKKACLLAKMSNVSSVLITGKGEPTLYPNQVTAFLEKLNEAEFPIIDLQTNGIKFMEEPKKYDAYLKTWHDLGLSVIAISIVHYKPEKNRQIYTPGKKEYYDLAKLVEKLHNFGFSVRFSVTMINGYTDNPKEVASMIEYARSLRIEQLSLRPVAMPYQSESPKYADATSKLLLTAKKITAISKYLDKVGHPLVTYGHESVVYDVDGQNVSLTNALTIKPLSEDIRQMIYFPDGHIRFDWQYKGAIIL